MTWIKIKSDPHGGKFLIFEHPYSGWQIEHCGHPTANWPYTLTSPDGWHLIVGPNGRGFPNLAAAKAGVAEILAGISRVTKDGRVLPINEPEPEDPTR